MNVLFICTHNLARSPTAERIFADWPGVKTYSAGLHDEACKPLSPELLAWADIVFVMERAHLDRLSNEFREHLGATRVESLDIPDEYGYLDPVLVDLLRQKITAFLPPR